MVLTDTNEKRIENYNLRNFTRLKDIFESFLTCWKVQNNFFIVELVDSVKNKKEYSFSGLFEYGDFYYEWCIKHRIWLERDTQKQRLELVLPNDKFFDNSLSQCTEEESNLYREYWIEMTDEQLAILFGILSKTYQMLILDSMMKTKTIILGTITLFPEWPFLMVLRN